MFATLVIASVLFSVMCIASASMKLTRDERAVTGIRDTVGVPLRLFPVLASLEVAGAAGILVGLYLEPLGVAAAAGLVAYFVGALAGHLRVGDTKGLTLPMPFLLLAIAVLALRLMTL